MHCPAAAFAHIVKILQHSHIDSVSLLKSIRNGQWDAAAFRRAAEDIWKVDQLIDSSEKRCPEISVSDLQYILSFIELCFNATDTWRIRRASEEHKQLRYLVGTLCDTVRDQLGHCGDVLLVAEVKKN